ncbi:MAG: glycosyltransferase family 4 protein [Gemmatimonadota bacterium]
MGAWEHGSMGFRIVISSAGMDWRGTETDTLLLADGLVASGHDVLVFCRRNSALSARLLADAIPFAPILGARDFGPASIARCIAALRRHRTQIVITQKDKDLRLTGVAGRVLRLPVLVRHVTDRPLKRGLRYRMLFGRVATHHLANSTSTRDTLVQSAPWLRAQIPIIYNGVDVDRYTNAARANLGLPDDAVVVGYMGAFEMRKGIVDFAEMWQRVASELPHAHAVIAGAGAREQQFRDVMGGAPRVHWLGFRRDTPNLLKALDVFVLPSRFEGFGLVLAEAMAAGVACAAYAASNIPELLEDGVTGLLAPVGDVDALAAAVESLCRSPELRLTLASAGQAYARRHFSAKRMVVEHEALVAGILSGR